MIITILEGTVPTNKWDDFENAYREAIKHAPLELRETFLIQDEQEHTLWRIITVWRDRKSYEAIKSSQRYATCVEIYKNVGVTPTRRIFNVIAHHMHV